jgi:hypothetical protein
MKTILLATVAAITLATGAAQAQLPPAEIAGIRTNIMSMIKAGLDADLSEAMRDPRNRLHPDSTRRHILDNLRSDLSVDYRECVSKTRAEKTLAERAGKPFYDDVTCVDELNWSRAAAEEWRRAK